MNAQAISGLRAQVLANAKIMLKATGGQPVPSDNGSQATLLPANLNYYGDLDVVVFGTAPNYIAAVMVGLTPAIEGEKAPNPEAAMVKLLSATCELLKMYIPKVGAHQRNIHGGGVFDEDMISAEVVEAQKKDHVVV
ncbi:hypothetical protein LTR37_016955 [Vermiconidia calcicola]|uniref:Uncharacterized protein n=1 Tax=Vermiconidia calcicola TaxID=1690605 RepID=A0ACC3MMV1_9PEZI|nr:hypothetical protein LTR37_016955 [Vermiconidia calcicola]